ncbi:putative copia-type protein [Trifolium pratense]|uniref:Putative copia-type protein n=1 Tax=Trifolium pratense TaxID=57577 RepID=A0A2K3PCU1_TRIPR|nr:putative copia-type protein [Trifolium pratense]
MPVYLSAYCDAGWGSDLEDWNSTSSASAFIEDNFISWWAKRKPVVSRSSIEAYYRSLALAISKLLWIQSLLTQLDVPCSSPIIVAHMPHMQADIVTKAFCPRSLCDSLLPPASNSLAPPASFSPSPLRHCSLLVPLPQAIAFYHLPVVTILD